MSQNTTAVDPTTESDEPTTADEPTVEITPELLAALSKSPEAVAAFAQLMAAQQEAAKAAEAAKFAKLGEPFELLVDTIADQYPLQTWYKKDRKTGERTNEVSGKGYHVQGPIPMTLNGRTYEANVNLWVKLTPRNSAPDLTASSES